jgi:uncharacterized protein YjiS (DUF1127 family)
MQRPSCNEERSAMAGLLLWPVRWMARRARALVVSWELREAIHVLHQMDERGLRDIGLTRSRIEDAVKGNMRSEIGRLR